MMFSDPAFSGFMLILAVLSLAAGASWRLGKLDGPGAVAAVAVGGGVYAGGHVPGLLLLIAFFVAGTVATSWKMRRKRALGLAEGNRGRRGVANVLANGGVAATLGVAAWLLREQAPLLLVMLAGSLASATADTLSSELGNIYGSRFVNVLTLRPDERGRDGVISPEGTLAGVLGSLLIAVLFALINPQAVAIMAVALAGIGGNLVDSLLGAGLQRRGYLGNHGVNFCNTFAAALLAGAILIAGG